MPAVATAANGPADVPAADVNSASPPHTALGDSPVRSFSEKKDRSPGEAPGAPPPSMDYSRVLGALAAVLGLIFLLRWCSRFFFPTMAGRRATRAVEVLARAPISPKQQIMLIRVGRRVLVVGDSGVQMNSLCEVSDPDEVAALVGQLQDERLAPAARAFGSMFGRSRRPFESADESGLGGALIDEPDETQTVASARDEISGLRDRVRLLAQQFKGT